MSYTQKSYVTLHKVQLPKKYKNNFSVDFFNLLKKLYVIENDYVKYRKIYRDSPQEVARIKEDFCLKIGEKIKTEFLVDEVMYDVFDLFDSHLLVGNYYIGKVSVDIILDEINNYCLECRPTLIKIRNLEEGEVNAIVLNNMKFTQNMLPNTLLTEMGFILGVLATSLIFFQNYLINSQLGTDTKLKLKTEFESTEGIVIEADWKEMGKVQLLNYLFLLNSVETSLLEYNNRYLLGLSLDIEGTIIYHFDIEYHLRNFEKQVPGSCIDRVPLLLESIKRLVLKKCTDRREANEICKKVVDIGITFLDSRGLLTRSEKKWDFTYIYS